MYLVVSGLKETWPEKEPFWLFHSGCYPDNIDKSKINDKRILGILPDPFADGKANRLHYDKIWQLTNEVINILYVRLNQIHGLNKDKRYWEIHIGFWVLKYVLAVYDRYSRLKVAKEKLSDLNVFCFRDRVQECPKDTLHFVNLLETDVYNVQFISEIAEKLSIRISEKEFKDTGVQNPQPNTIRRVSLKKVFFKSLLNLFLNGLDKVFSKINKERIYIESSYFPRWFEFLLSVSSLGKISQLKKSENFNSAESKKPFDKNSRDFLSQYDQNDNELAVILIQLVGKYIPKSLIEDFSDNFKISKQIYGDSNCKLLYSTVSWTFDEKFLHFASESREKGTKLVGGEHGGAPFIERYQIIYKMESLVSDFYFTWGWSDVHKPNIVATPGSKLVGLRVGNSFPKGDSILYVCTANPRFAISALEDFSQYLGWQKVFFEKIDKALIGKFIVRAHYIDYNWGIREKILNINPDIKFDDWKITFNERLSKRNSRLYVFDYISTTFVESLSSNLPTVLYFDRSLYPVVESFNSDFEKLKKVKVFHDTPESAAEWINQVYDSSNDWFYNKECQDVVKDFCYRYGRRSKTPVRDWLQVFNRISTS